VREVDKPGHFLFALSDDIAIAPSNHLNIDETERIY